MFGCLDRCCTADVVDNVVDHRGRGLMSFIQADTGHRGSLEKDDVVFGSLRLNQCFFYDFLFIIQLAPLKHILKPIHPDVG